MYEKILKEKILFGRRGTEQEKLSRVTYLAVDYNEACCYGDIILKVWYNPYRNKKMNNYIVGCWQCRVYEKIFLEDIKKVS